MEFDVDQEMEIIIEKYNLDRHYSEYRISKQACVYIRNWVENLSEQDIKILFITMDESVFWMLRGWAMGENISVIQISSVEGLDNHIEALKNVDKVYIIAYTRTVEILHWLWRHDFQAESVYDILENQHIYCQMEFYRFFPPFNVGRELELGDMFEEINTDGTALTLYEYHYQKQRLQHSNSEKDKRKFSEKLFFLAIHMRNFIEAERILSTMSCSEEYRKCWKEIKALLDKMKGILTQKKQNHIIVYWLDALSYEDAEKLEYLQEQRRHSLYFHNAFTLTPNTYPTFKTMFFGIRQVDDLGYKVYRVVLCDSPLMQDIMEHGYDFKLLSNYINRRLDTNDNCDYYGQQILNISCSEVFWSLTKQIIQSSLPTVYLVHALVELHSPRLSVRRNRFEKEYESTPETWQVQSDELNGQLRFYDQMLGDSSYRIYMGDHGALGPITDRLHVCFQIYYAAWKNKEVNKLFCYLDFPKIMHQLLLGEEIEDTTWEREYVPIQDVDYYNPERLKNFIDQKQLDVLLPWFIAYKGVVTSEYIYFNFRNGDELYHRWLEGVYLPNVGFADLRESSELLNELRKKVGEFPKELYKDPKFEYARNTYTILENVKRTIREAMKLLNDKIAGKEYTDGSIVLRPGGYHTMRLCAVLSEENRKKIGGVIDQNPDCMCKDLGYSIYLPGDKLSDNIKVVLLSTYDNRDILKCDIQKQYSDLEIIDIYQYWRNCGFNFSKNFWYGLEADWDIAFLKE